MRPEPKKRVPTDAPQTALGGLEDAFAGVDLPVGPPEPTATSQALPIPPAPGWKMGRVVLRCERAGRGGKTVIVVDDFASHLPAAVIERTAKQIRAACGCGGTVKDRRIEVQGDQPAKVRTALEAEGFQVAGVR